MRLMLWSCAAVLAVGLTSSAVDAFSCTPMCYCPPVCCVTYQPKVVTCYKTVAKDEQVPVTVQKVSLVEQRTKVKVTVQVQKFFDEAVQKSYQLAVPKLVEQHIKVCVMVPVAMYDPCTCCCYIRYCPTYVDKTVHCTVFNYKLETRTELVKVCRLVPEERIVEQCNLVKVVTPEAVMQIRRTHVLVPYQVTVLVPVLCCR